MMYHIVLFKGEHAVEIVPTRWVTLDQQYCQWPPKGTIKSKISKLIENRIAPEREWEKFSIRVLDSADSFSSAREKAKEAENTSTCAESDSEMVDNLKARKKKGTSSFYDNSDASSDENGAINEELLPTPPPKKAKKDLEGTTRASSSLSRTPSYRADSEKTTPASSPLSRTPNFSTAQPTNLEVPSNDPEAFQKKLLTVIENLRYEVKCLSKEVRQNTSTIQKLTDELDDKVNHKSSELPLDENLLAGLPLQTEDDIVQFEKLLEDGNFITKLAHRLSKAGGDEPNTTTALLMRRMIGKVATEYSFKGRKGKKPFNALKLNSVVFRAVRIRHENADDEAVAKKISFFLAGAGDRNGGRRARNKQGENKAQGEKEAQAPQTQSLQPSLDESG